MRRIVRKGRAFTAPQRGTRGGALAGWLLGRWLAQFLGRLAKHEEGLFFDALFEHRRVVCCQHEPSFFLLASGGMTD